jgi:hypothetical protein
MPVQGWLLLLVLLLLKHFKAVDHQAACLLRQ